MRWLPLTALVLVASCSSVWSNCTAPDQRPCEYANLTASACPGGMRCTPTGLCEPSPDAATSEKDAGVDGAASCVPQSGTPPVSTICNTGLCWENPLSQGKDLHAVWGASPSQVWAVGNAGTILLWNGTQWFVTPSGVTANLNGVWGSSTNDVWAVGDGGTILHWNGNFWSRSAVPVGSVGLTAVWGSGATDVWTVGSAGTILHWTAACTWTTVPSGTTGRLAAVYGTSASDAWAVGGSGAALRWDGSSWQLLNVGTAGATGPELTGVWASRPSDVWAVGGNGTSFHWNGMTWAMVPTGLNAALSGVWGSNSSALWAVHDGGILSSDGATWRSVFSSPQKPLYAVWGSSPQDLWAVGAYGSIVHGTGSVWTPVQTTSDLAAIAAFADGSSWAVGRANTIVQRGSNSSSPTWTPVNVAVAPPVDLTGLWGSSSLNMWAVGDLTTILNGKADAWSVRKAPTSLRYSGVWGSSMASFWTVSMGGQLMNWDGNLNGGVQFDAGAPLFAIYGTKASDIWVAGKGYIGHSDGMALLPKKASAETYNGLWADARTVWAVGTNSSIIRMTDQDGNWYVETIASTPQVTLNGIWGVDGEHLWAVGNEGTLLKRVGMSWVPQKTGVNDNLNAIAGLSAQNFWVVGNNGTILQYRGP